MTSIIADLFHSPRGGIPAIVPVASIAVLFSICAYGTFKDIHDSIYYPLQNKAKLDGNCVRADIQNDKVFLPPGCSLKLIP